MDYYPVDLFNISRKSRDEIVNNFGRSLLSLCRELGVHTLNGRNGKDLNGEFTYLSRAGASVIDYTIVSTDIYKNFFKFEVQNLDFSDHFPLYASFENISAGKVKTEPLNKVKQLGKPIRFRWKDDERNASVNTICVENDEKLWTEFETLVISDVDKSVSLLILIIHRAAGTMVVKNYNGRKTSSTSNMSQPSWWNNECRKAKATKYALLNTFRQTHTEEDRQNYLESKSIFKMLCRENKRLEKEKLKQKLILKVDDPRLFWKTLKESRTVASVQNNISAFDWYSHFKSALNQDIKIDPIFEETVRSFNTEHDIRCDPCRLNEGNQDPLNAVISREEIVKGI